MARKMTVVFHDEDLYTELKVLAVKQRKTASEIVAAAVREWIEAQEDEALLPVIKARETEREKRGGRPWPEVEREWDMSVSERQKSPIVADRENVQD